MPLNNFKTEYRELVLNFLWRQWSALGVAGSVTSDDNWILDAEALLIFTCTMGRHDARVFDEMVDWLHKNGAFINIARLKRMIKEDGFSGQRELSAVASTMAHGEYALKWKKLAEAGLSDSQTEEPFFFLQNGLTIPVMREPDPYFVKYGFLRDALNLRGYSKNFKPTAPTNVLLQLRGLFGVNARSEILAYLLTHSSAHPSLIARETYYNQKTVQNALVDMAASGVIRVKNVGREKHYWTKPDVWEVLLERQTGMPQWITWPPFFRALEIVWFKLNDPRLLKHTEPLHIASNLRRIMLEVRPLIERAGFAHQLSDDQQHHGEVYLEVFFSDIRRLLK